MTNKQSETNIYTALSAVMAAVGYVQKEKSPNLTYTFASEQALIAAIRPHMVANQITVNPAGVRDIVNEQYPNAKGTIMKRVLGLFTFTFYHGPSGTGFNVEVLGEGVDSGDKAANKAMTAAYKYALRQTLMIETGDDPDTTSSETLAGRVDKETGEIKTTQPPVGSAPSKMAQTQTTLPFAPDKYLSDFESKDWTAFYPFMAARVAPLGYTPGSVNKFLHELTGLQTLKDYGGTFADILTSVDTYVASQRQ